MGDIGTKLSDELSATIATASTSVVRVEARGWRASSGIVWSEGVIVTADHTVERDEGIEIGLADGRTVAATLAGREPAVDLAVLKVEATGLVAAPWTETASLRIGNLVLAIARSGRGERAVLGMVSALGVGWRTAAGGRIDTYLQPDFGLFPGFSGSLLVDLNGRALGMNTSGLMRGKPLALPVASLKRVVGEILTHGGSQRGFLGVGTLPVRLPTALKSKTGSAAALLVVAVQPGSPADRAGVLLGDLLVTLHGKSTHRVADLFAALDDLRAGSIAVAQVLRGGEPRDLQITVGARAA